MTGNPSPPLDLDAFRKRNERIARARAEARETFTRQGLAESEHEHDYRKTKAVAMARLRSEGKGVTEAEIAADGEAAGHRRKRDDAHILRRAAELRIAELEGNRAMLRSDSDWSQRIDPTGSEAA